MTLTLRVYYQTAVSLLGTGLKTLVTGVEQILLETDEESLPELNFEEKINELESSNTSYTNEIENDEFTQWNNQFVNDIDNYKDRITEILIECPIVRRKYNQLVPNDVSHNLFWSRYLYKRQIIENEQKLKTQIVTNEPVADNLSVSATENKTEENEIDQNSLKASQEKSSETIEESRPVDSKAIETVRKETVDTVDAEKSAEAKTPEKCEIEEKCEKQSSEKETKSHQEPVDKIESTECPKSVPANEKKSSDINKVSLSSSDEDLVKIKSKEEDLDDWEDDLDIDDVDITDVNLDDDDWQMSD